MILITLIAYIGIFSDLLPSPLVPRGFNPIQAFYEKNTSSPLVQQHAPGNHNGPCRTVSGYVPIQCQRDTAQPIIAILTTDNSALPWLS